MPGPLSSLVKSSIESDKSNVKVKHKTLLQDAELLHHKLIDVVTKGVPLLQAKVEYETAMLAYGFEAVANSIDKPLFGPPRSQPNASKPEESDQAHHPK